MPVISKNIICFNLWSSAVAAVASDVTVQPEKPHAEEAGSKKVWGGGGGGGGGREFARHSM